ncbi:MAG: DNA-processing protein DprA [Candidatus Omnitrophota bacterium]|nr:MAG: DNA-processing protein DprA [Candidatus Omnitrophota bacterium]
MISQVSLKKIKKSNKVYPDNLKNIYNPPEDLFVDGEILPSDNNAIAIVGTRRASYYGMEQCEKLSYDLAIRGITIVSGMARGIDSAAHRGALKAQGRTIAVLGSGHDHIYPPENKKLYDEIVKSGAVVSEYEPNTPPFKANFPRRNRIISGMSKGVVVIEAPRKSGAMITADFALEQGREVFALPGNITSIRSSGTNALIKEGAKLVEGISDILEELKNVIDIKEIDKASSGICRPGDPDMRGLDSDEKMIFGILNDKSKSIDEISRIANLPVYKASKALLKLELKRLIKGLPGENFVRI